VTRVWPGLEVNTRRFHLGQSWWRKMQSVGLSKQYGKKDSEVSQFLKKIFGLSLLPPGEVCDWFALEFLSNLPNDKRVEVLRLPDRKLYWCRLHFSSACLVRMYCIIIEDHERMWVIPWPLQRTILQCASYNFCSCICTEKKNRIKPTSKWKVSLHKDLKIQLRSKKEDLIS